MKDSHDTNHRGTINTNTACRRGDHRASLNEMMAVALYPDGDGADDEMLLLYATEAAKGNPEYLEGIEAEGLEYDIAVGLAGNHAAGLLIDEVNALTGVTDARLPAVARVVMGAVSSMNRPDSAAGSAPPEWLSSLLDRLADTIDSEGGQCAACGRDFAPTLADDNL